MQLSIVAPGYWLQALVALEQVCAVHVGAPPPPPGPALGASQREVPCTVAQVLPAASATIAYGDRCVVTPDTVLACVSTTAPGRICHDPPANVATRNDDSGMPVTSVAV